MTALRLRSFAIGLFVAILGSKDRHARAQPDARKETQRKLAPDLEQLRRAQLLIEEGRLAEARDRLEKNISTLDDYRRWLLARTKHKMGDAKGALAVLDPLTRATSRCKTSTSPPTLALDALELTAEILERTSPALAADLLSQMPAYGPRIARAVSLYRRAALDEKAAALEARLLEDLPDVPEALSLSVALGKHGVRDRLGTIDRRLRRASMLLDRNQNETAVEELSVLERELDRRDVRFCEVLFLRGKGERKLRRYRPALATLSRARRICQERGIPGFSARAALVEVQVQAILGQVSEALATHAWLAEHQPRHSFLDDALITIADVMERSSRTAEAVELYREITSDRAATDQFHEAAWRLARRSLFAGDAIRAIPWLEDIAGSTDASAHERVRAQYWLGRVRATRDPTAAKTHFENAVLSLQFYGWLAFDHVRRTDAHFADELKRRLLSVRDAGARSDILHDPIAKILGSDPSGAQRPADSRSIHFARALDFHVLGSSRYAESELREAECDAVPAGDALRLALAYDFIGRPDRAQNALRTRGANILEKGFSAETAAAWFIAYSRPFRSDVEAASARAGFEAELLFALAREESTFDPNIVSWAGAIGLTQLMPSTALAAYSKYHRGRLELLRLREPALNLDLGARVLKEGLDRFGNDRALALVSYNAGFGVASKLAKKPARPFEQWVEEIPIRETRHYVQRVLQSWAIYRLLYDARRPVIELPATR